MSAVEHTIPAELHEAALERGWKVERGAENKAAPWRRVFIASRPDGGGNRNLYVSDADRLKRRITQVRYHPMKEKQHEQD